MYHDASASISVKKETKSNLSTDLRLYLNGNAKCHCMMRRGDATYYASGLFLELFCLVPDLYDECPYNWKSCGSAEAEDARHERGGGEGKEKYPGHDAGDSGAACKDIVKLTFYFICQVEAERREIALSEVVNLEEKLLDLEEKLAKKKDMAKEATEMTTNLGKESEEALRLARVLRNKNRIEDEQVATLEKQLDRTLQIEKESEEKYDEVVKKMELVEGKLEQVEKRASGIEAEKLKLEDELKCLWSSLKSVECSNDKAFKKEESYSTKIKIMEAKTKEAEGRADLMEKNVSILQGEVDRLEGMLEEVVSKNKKAEEEMEAVFQDLRNM